MLVIVAVVVVALLVAALITWTMLGGSVDPRTWPLFESPGAYLDAALERVST